MLTYRTKKYTLEMRRFAILIRASFHEGLSLSQTCNCQKGSNWLKSWVAALHNILVVRCFMIGQ